MKKLIITNAKNKKCAALLENDKLIDLDVLYDESESFLGNIYVGRVENVVNNINAAFVEIKKGVKCFYSLTDNPKPIFLNHKQNEKVCIGDLLLVRVVRDPIKLKMAVCDSSVAVSGKYVVANNKGEIGISNKITDISIKKHLTELLEGIKNENHGFIIRTCAQDANDEEIISEAVKLCELIDRIIAIAKYRTAFTCLYKENDSCILKNYNLDDMEKIVTDDIDEYGRMTSYLNSYEHEHINKLSLYEDNYLSVDKLYNLTTQIDNALKKRVWLKSGAFLVIEPTEALTVIDVNTGKFISRSKDREETFLKVNLEACDTIGREIHLRNYSGIILVDFIDMTSKEANETLMTYLKKVLDADKVKTTLVDMTKLGLCEITRKRVKKPLHEEFSNDKISDI